MIKKPPAAGMEAGGGNPNGECKEKMLSTSIISK